MFPKKFKIQSDFFFIGTRKGVKNSLLCGEVRRVTVQNVRVRDFS